MKKAVILMGVPGSGKSTYAQGNTFKGYSRIERDEIRQELLGNAQDFSREEEVTIQADKKIERAARTGKNIVISDTNLNKDFRNLLIAKLQTLGFQVEIQVMNTSLAVCKDRNKNRDRNVPNEVIEKMHASLWDEFANHEVLQLPSNNVLAQDDTVIVKFLRG